jgi:predicted amidohydrolase
MLRRVAAAQLELVGDDREGNLKRALALARKAVAGRAEFVCFPECMTSDYTRQAARFAEPIPGPTCEPFLELARKSGTHFLIGLFERDGDHTYNTVAILGPDGLAGRYRKRKLWVDSQHLEGLDDPGMFAPGDLPNVSASSSAGTGSTMRSGRTSGPGAPGSSSTQTTGAPSSLRWSPSGPRPSASPSWA